MKKVILLLCTITACGPGTDDDADTAVTLSALAEVRSGAPLEEMLYTLDEHLMRALSGRMQGESVNDFRRAEALTDRLLEARMPFEWISGDSYSLESRLRQVQSSADRVLALLQTNAPEDTLMTSLRAFRAEVIALRESVARGGTRAPPPIERLLAGDTSSLPEGAGGQSGAAPPAEPAEPAGPRPLGTPVTTGGE